MSNPEQWNFDNCWPDPSSADSFKEVHQLLAPDILNRERCYRQCRAQIKLNEECALDYAIANHRLDDPYFPCPQALPSFNDSTMKGRYPPSYPQYGAAQMQREKSAHVAQEHPTYSQYAHMPHPPPMKILSNPQSTHLTSPHPKIAICKLNHTGVCCNESFEYRTRDDITKHLLSDSHPHLRPLPDRENYNRLLGICKWQDQSAEGRSPLCGLTVPFSRLSEHIERHHLKQA